MSFASIGLGSRGEDRWWGFECVSKHLMIGNAIERGYDSLVVNLQNEATEVNVEPGWIV